MGYVQSGRAVGRTLKSAIAAAALLLGAGAVQAQDAWPAPVEGSAVIENFALGSGEVMPELRMHYRTIGEPRRDADGRIVNAVLLLHGTGGTGAQFLQPHFAGALFGPGQPLDAGRYYLILPDNLGHGGSSKPSDGPRAAFPEYGYADMVEAQRRLLTEALGVERLRLNFGTSMGCMHIFIWGQAHPDFADALMPMACQPVEIAGRNRLWRALLQDAIRADPAWMGGDYQTQPIQGLRAAVSLQMMASSTVLRTHADYPTREAVDAWVATEVDRRIAALDANDLWYQVNASHDYDPSAGLERITAPLTWINSGDDFINPVELGYPEAHAARMPNAVYRLVPASETTRGHSTHTWPEFWIDDMIALLERSAR